MDNGIDKLVFDAINRFSEENGYLMCGKTIMDAAIIDAPKSTKNAKQERNPEIHRTKKGNVWYFGAKLHGGLDAGFRLVHTVVMTVANVHDATPAPKLLRKDDKVAYNDSAYCTVENHDEVKNDPALSKIDSRVNK